MSALLPIPQRGLEAALRTWTGRGSLLEALRVPQPEPGALPERQWSDDDVLLRARRLLWERLAPDIAAWPEREHAWLDALPISTVQANVDLGRPGPGTQWARARIRGTPMRTFPSRPRTRVLDPRVLSVLAWTLRELAPVRTAAAEPSTPTGTQALRRADAALRLLDHEPVATSDARRPARGEVRALGALGRPWRTLSAVCSRLLALHDPTSAAALAAEMLAPDPDHAWRLFHLAVLGELLLALRGGGADVVSLRPLGAPGAKGPAFQVVDAEGRRWDLWFEAAGAWSAYGVREPYADFTSTLNGVYQPLGPDLLLVGPGGRALVFECKYSNDVTYAVRTGYHQIVSYTAEAAHLVAGHDVSGYVVAPSSLVPATATAASTVGEIGLTSPEGLAVILEYALNPQDDDT